MRLGIMHAVCLMVLAALACAIACGQTAPEQAADNADAAHAALEVACKLAAPAPNLRALLAANPHGFLRAKDGNWQLGAAAPHAAALTAEAPETGAGKLVIRPESYANYTIQLQLLHAQDAAPIEEHGRVVYPNALPGIHRIVSGDWRAVEDAYLITDAAVAISGQFELQYAIALPAGVQQLRVLSDQSALFEDAGGTARLAMAAPIALDAAGHQHPVHTQWDASRRVLSLTLSAAGIALPALLDPQFVRFGLQERISSTAVPQATTIEFDAAWSRYLRLDNPIAFGNNTVHVLGAKGWREIPILGPMPRITIGSSASNNRSGRIVVAAQRNLLQPDDAPELWEFQGSSWIQLPAPNALDMRLQPGLDYAPISDNTRLVGSLRQDPSKLAVWELSGGIWTQVGVEVAHTLSGITSLAHDPQSGNPITWVDEKRDRFRTGTTEARELVGNAWVLRADLTIRDTEQTGRLEYAAWTGEWWLNARRSNSDSTRVLRNGRWQTLNLPLAARDFVLDTVNNRVSCLEQFGSVVRFSELSPAGLRPLTPQYPFPPLPSRRLRLAELKQLGRWLAYDQDEPSAAAGGFTWSYDGTAWTPLLRGVQPGLRDVMMAYDEVRKTVVMLGRRAGPFGSTTPPEAREVWEHDGAQWRQIGATSYPFNNVARHTATLPGGGIALLIRNDQPAPAPGAPAATPLYEFYMLKGTSFTQLGTAQGTNEEDTPVALWLRPGRFSFLLQNGKFADLVDGKQAYSAEFPTRRFGFGEHARAFEANANTYVYSDEPQLRVEVLDQVSGPTWRSPALLNIANLPSNEAMFTAALAGAPNTQLYFPESARSIELATFGAACDASRPCSVGYCTDGVCCAESSCDSTCSSCAVGNGTCEAVTNAEDPDSCDVRLGLTCDRNAVCRRAAASECASDEECASGFCTDGVCCNEFCGNACHECKSNLDGKPGQCLSADPMLDPTCELACVTGITDCGGYACDKNTGLCRAACGADNDCTGGYTCQNKRCDPPQQPNARCSVGVVHGTGASCADCGYLLTLFAIFAMRRRKRTKLVGVGRALG